MVSNISNYLIIFYVIVRRLQSSKVLFHFLFFILFQVTVWEFLFVYKILRILVLFSSVLITAQLSHQNGTVVKTKMFTKLCTLII